MDRLRKSVQDIDKKSMTPGGMRLLTRALSKLGVNVTRAISFATAAHHGQERKYSKIPYVSHCIAVASIVKEAGGSEDMIIAALLHDTVEDTHITNEDIRRAFGDNVASLVQDLTDISEPHMGNRATRKAIDREHSASASTDAKTVKLADLIHNSFSIRTSDPGFARVWLEEKRALLKVLTDGDVDLHALAMELAKE